MKQALLIIPMVVALAGCGQSDKISKIVEEDSTASKEAASPSGDMPNVNASVAPGVAFNYDYGFSLDEAKIARMQEVHAGQCAKLGLRQCRVTGLNFSKSRTDTTRGSLSLKLDPSIALKFAREATEAVEKDGGKLETSEVRGEDVGGDVTYVKRGAAEINADLARIGEQLKSGTLSAEAKAELVAQDGRLREELRALSQEKEQKLEVLATAPMTFNYRVGETVLGFDRQSTVGAALLMGQDSLSAMLAFFTLLIGGLGPWIALGLAGYWLWRRFWPRKAKAADA